MAISEVSLIAVFLTGLLGGVHCAGMCGGIVSALGMMRQKPASTIGSIAVRSELTLAPPSTLTSVSLYNMGRISMYTFLGILAGALGSMVWLMESLFPVQQIAFFFSNVLIVLMGLYVIGIKRIATTVEALGAPLWQKVRPAATRQLSSTGRVNNVLTGALWGLVPCGMVYAVLSAALVSGSALNGGLLMFAFGLGTLPNLMLLGMSGQWLARASKNVWVRRLAGALIIGFGLMGFMHLSMMSHGAAHSMSSNMVME